MKRRVAVTGLGALTPFGYGCEPSLRALHANETVVRAYPEWDSFRGLRTRCGANVSDQDIPNTLPLKVSRSMGRVALLAYHAAELALTNAKIDFGSAQLQNGSCGVAFGSGIGSIAALSDYSSFITDKSTQGLSSTTYHRMMSHTCASNIGIALGITGRIIPTSSACTSGSQGIGFGYEAIRSGVQERMITGGAEEFGPAVVAIFDVLGACSLANPNEICTPRPFDEKRDGIVVTEGAGALILEEYDAALARGAPILAEIVGFGTNSDGWHITNPKAETMALCIQLALSDASLSARDIGYINAHGTGTALGDRAETLAMQEVFAGSDAHFGDAQISGVPISSFKGHLGHTLGACGALEAALMIEMVRGGWLCGTRNLVTPLLESAGLNLISSRVSLAGSYGQNLYAMSNTFAFGGINTSIIFKIVTGQHLLGVIR